MEIISSSFPVSRIAIPSQVQDQVVGFQTFRHCYLFAKPSFQASFWLVLKREGLKGDLFVESSELSALVSELGEDALHQIIILSGKNPTGERLNRSQAKKVFRDLALKQQIKIYKLSHALRPRLADISDNLYASRQSHQFSPLLPVIRQKHQLAQELGKELLARWDAKADADREHFERHFLIRELVEIYDSGAEAVDTVGDFLMSLVDIGVLVIELTYEGAKLVVQFTGNLISMQAKALTGDIDGLKQDLAAIGVFLEDSVKDAQALMRKIEEGKRILGLILSDRQVRTLIMDYFSSLYQSVPYRQSRNIEFRIVCEVGLEILLALATRGVGNVARASKATRIGPFTTKAIDLMGDIAGKLKIDKKGVKVKPVDSLTLPDYANKRPKKLPEKDLGKPAGSGSEGNIDSGMMPSEKIVSNKVEQSSRTNFEFNSIENPGPLADMRGTPAANFYAGRYNATTLDEDLVLYRGGNGGGGRNAYGQWFTKEAPESVVQVRIDTAVKDQWIDPVTGELTGTSPINSVYGIKIPKGTTIYEGPVASQGSIYLGGDNINQIFVPKPWDIKGHEIVFEGPLK